MGRSGERKKKEKMERGEEEGDLKAWMNGE